MILSTTSTLDGYTTREPQFISAEVIIGANVFKDIFAALTNFFGGRSGSYEQALIAGKNNAMDELIEKATKLGADAVIGIDLDYDAIGKNGSMFMINVTGTAVKITKN